MLATNDYVILDTIQVTPQRASQACKAQLEASSLRPPKAKMDAYARQNLLHDNDEPSETTLEDPSVPRNSPQSPPGVEIALYIWKCRAQLKRFARHR